MQPGKGRGAALCNAYRIYRFICWPGSAAGRKPGKANYIYNVSVNGWHNAQKHPLTFVYNPILQSVNRFGTLLTDKASQQKILVDELKAIIENQ